MALELTIKVVSLLAILVPAAAFARALYQTLFPSRVVITDKKGNLVREFAVDSILREDPAEMKKFHKSINRRIRDAKAA